MPKRWSTPSPASTRTGGESDRLSILPWLRPYATPPFPAVLAANAKAAWPRFLELVGADLSSRLRDFGQRLPSLIPWYLEQISRPPCTFIHGDLRLDQLFFGTRPGDPAVTALDWQVTQLGRGAYDLAYFVSQSLTTEARRACEAALIERYRSRLAEAGIDYPIKRTTARLPAHHGAVLHLSPLVAGRIEVVNDRHLDLLRTMASGAAAIEDHDALALRPD